MITQKRIKELFKYNPETGEFERISPVKKARVGDIAGCLMKNGYISISVDCSRYYSHRLAFLYMTGEIPSQVDHIDGNRSNNQWGNLREATNSLNGANKPKQSNTVSKFKGVSVHKSSGLWRARIKVNKKESHLGLFHDEIAAAKAYNEAAIQHFGNYARLNDV